MAETLYTSLYIYVGAELGRGEATWVTQIVTVGDGGVGGLWSISIEICALGLYTLPLKALH